MAIYNCQAIDQYRTYARYEVYQSIIYCMNRVEAKCLVPCRLPMCPDADVTVVLSPQEHRSNHRPGKERKNGIQFFHLHQTEERLRP